MKTYIVKIQSEGVYHHQIISDEDDLAILMAVLKKIELGSAKAVNDFNKQKIEKDSSL